MQEILRYNPPYAATIRKLIETRFADPEALLRHVREQRRLRAGGQCWALSLRGCNVPVHRGGAFVAASFQPCLRSGRHRSGRSAATPRPCSSVWPRRLLRELGPSGSRYQILSALQARGDLRSRSQSILANFGCALAINWLRECSHSALAWRRGLVIQCVLWKLSVRAVTVSFTRRGRT